MAITTEPPAGPPGLPHAPEHFMEEVLGLFQSTRSLYEPVASFFKRYGLPTRGWSPDGYELHEGATCAVGLPPDSFLSYGEEQRVTAVVLVAEELAPRGRPVPLDLAAVSALALALGLVTVTRKAQS